MSHPPNKPPQDSDNAHTPHDANLPVPSQQHGGEGSGEEQRRVIDAEVVFMSDRQQNQEQHQDTTYGRNGRQDGSEGYGQTDGRGRFYQRTFGGRNFGSFQSGSPLGQIWITGRDSSNACLAPCITFAIFLVCLAQFGFLAGLGFVFFHTIGSLAGTLRQMRLMTAGVMPNPWLWRMGNWILSFLVTLWLAGGFN
jgi:hypothetical protein